MKNLMSLLGLVLLFIGLELQADEKITVASTNDDISQNLDLRVVAKLFAESDNLEEFEQNLNKPENNYSNLDLNGDGIVDYIRVVETGEGNKRLIILQAVLAKDVYQDVASIFVEKDANDQVSVQIVGDEYVYGTNYIIEPYYFYRPYIYDWFWGPHWACWHSPYYWGYYPTWWHHHHPLGLYDYYGHCHHFCSHHVCCSYHIGATLRPATRMALRNNPVRRNDYAVAHVNKSFATRNARITPNAHYYDKTRVSATRSATRTAAPTAASVRRTSTTRSNIAVNRETSPSAARIASSPTTREAAAKTSQRSAPAQARTSANRTFGSSNIVNARASIASNSGVARSSNSGANIARTPSTRTNAARTTSRTTSTPQVSGNTATITRSSSPRISGNTTTVTRSSTASTSPQRSVSTSSQSRSSSTSYRRSPSTSSSSVRSSGSSSVSSSRSSGGYSGGSRSSGSSGGGSRTRR